MIAPIYTLAHLQIISEGNFFAKQKTTHRYGEPEAILYNLSTKNPNEMIHSLSFFDGLLLNTIALLSYSTSFTPKRKLITLAMAKK